MGCSCRQALYRAVSQLPGREGGLVWSRRNRLAGMLPASLRSLTLGEGKCCCSKLTGLAPALCLVLVSEIVG